jgi:hypothetical protein
MEEIKDRLTNIEKTLAEITKKLDNISCGESKMQPKIANFGEDLHSVDKKLVKKLLNARNIIGDIKFIKELMLKNKEPKHYPIKNIDGRKNYQYHYNGRWIDDNGGEHIKQELTKILDKHYRKVNQFTNPSEMDEMVDNQKYINNLKTEKYMTKLLNNLKKHILV